MSFDILFADAALELIPPEVFEQLKKSRKFRESPPKTTLLDNTDHNFAMQQLHEKNQRGRPDILHHCLLNSLDTPLAQTGKLQVYFHIREGRVFSLKQGTRIPRNYNRFVGVMTQLLFNNHVPDNPPFHIERVDETLREFFSLQHYDHICILTRTGEALDLSSHYSVFTDKKTLCVIGAFQDGFFQESTVQTFNAYSYHLISISSYGLSAGTVASRVIYAYELALNAESLKRA